MCAVAAVTLLTGCTDSAEKPRSSPAESAATTTATQPATTPGDLDGQVLRIAVLKDGDAFDTRNLTAHPGVTTIELRNPSDRPFVLAIARDGTVLAEGQPATGAQIGRVTLPVETGTYHYYVIGHEQKATFSGTLTIRQH